MSDISYSSFSSISLPFAPTSEERALAQINEAERQRRLQEEADAIYAAAQERIRREREAAENEKLRLAALAALGGATGPRPGTIAQQPPVQQPPVQQPPVQQPPVQQQSEPDPIEDRINQMRGFFNILNDRKTKLDNKVFKQIQSLYERDINSNELWVTFLNVNAKSTGNYSGWKKWFTWSNQYHTKRIGGFKAPPLPTGGRGLTPRSRGGIFAPVRPQLNTGGQTPRASTANYRPSGYTQ